MKRWGKSGGEDDQNALHEILKKVIINIKLKNELQSVIYLNKLKKQIDQRGLKQGKNTI